MTIVIDNIRRVLYTCMGVAEDDGCIPVSIVLDAVGVSIVGVLVIGASGSIVDVSVADVFVVAVGCSVVVVGVTAVSLAGGNSSVYNLTIHCSINYYNTPHQALSFH